MKKGKGGDEDKGEGTEKKSKKEKNEIYDSVIEDTGSLFNEEKIEVQEDNVQRVVLFFLYFYNSLYIFFLTLNLFFHFFYHSLYIFFLNLYLFFK
jgi:hypothetical protein